MLNVIVDTFTVMEPVQYNASPTENFSFDILHSIHAPLDSDLYVSTSGDNINSGTSPEEPFRNIGFALSLIRADRDNPHTIFIAPGYYSPNTNREFFSLQLKSYVSLSNVTISNNSAGENGGGLYSQDSDMKIVNTVFWNNEPNEIFFYDKDQPSSLEIAYSNIKGGEEEIITNNNGTVNWLEGNINSDPLFVSPEDSIFHLQSSSPCIDSGTPYFIMGWDTLVNLTEDDYIGTNPDMGALEFDPSVSVIEHKVKIPEKFLLFQNYPNPFNSWTVIEYSLPEVSFVSLKVYDILGKEVTTLVSEEQYAGNYKLNFDASNLTSGIYFYKIQVTMRQSTGNFINIKKLILTK